MDDRKTGALIRCSALVFRESRILLCRRKESEWILPGGTPRIGEGAGACVQREILEETGIAVDPDRVAFVLDASHHEADQHLIEIVFTATERDRTLTPRQLEVGLSPEFVPVDSLSQLSLKPPIAGYIRGLLLRWNRSGSSIRDTGAYLGNLWRTPTEYESIGTCFPGD